ncbi:SusC/RagA family TonB-linked outer membrane protein [Leyella stercorea]|uniref:SusC/RagA family TonB-linked outer membrane protein n=1 Tax=Leyella stercorea TaxID=363265 RepID=UPI002431BD92|nr:TonB-dependent receptor [Leyella stercorea]
MKKQVKFPNALRTATLSAGLFLSASAFAQQVVVKGNVVDETGEPVIGASVKVVGGTLGTVTDIDGNFTLNADKKSTIEVTYIGYEPVKMQAGQNLTIHLKNTSSTLNEVVVIGYGAVKKSDLTGSVTALKPDSKNKGLVVNAQDMLSGKVAGVNVTSNSGEPGVGTQIRIRGGSSLNASNDPLIVIDGVPMDNNKVGVTMGNSASNLLSTINPQDIESFNVLKDASATAIYGSRGSNGVIIITTKKGHKGQKPEVSYSGSVSVSQKKKTYDMMDGDQYRAYVKSLFNENDDAVKALGTANTDWQDLIYRTAVSHDHNVTVAGSAGKFLPYRVSVGYTSQQGILKNSDYNRYTASVNLNPSLLNDHLNLNLNAKGMFSKAKKADTGAIGNAVSFDPTQSPYAFTSQRDLAMLGANAQQTLQNFGGYFNWLTSASAYNNPQWPFVRFNDAPANPLAQLELGGNVEKVRSFIGSADIDYKVHGFEDLRLHMTLGAEIAKGTVDETQPTSYPTTLYYGGITDNENFKRNLLLSAYAQYYKDFSKNHHFDIMGGYEYQHFYFDYNNSWMQYYPESDAQAGNVFKDTKDIDKYENFLVSFFGRANYTLMNRYFFTATVRDDGSSRFKDHWGLFPSFAFAWRMKDENNLKDIKWLSDLKFRAGYGVTGQQEGISNYLWFKQYKKGQNYGQYPIVGDGTIYTPLYYNDKLKWEKTTTYNLGLDFGICNRLTGSIDWYVRKTDDLINSAPVAALAGSADKGIQNIGSMKNTGVELSLNYVAVNTKDWYWTMNYNLTYNRNRITDLNGVSDTGDPVTTGDNIDNVNKVLAYQTGYAANSFYVYEQMYDKNGKPIEGAVVDRNGDGVISNADKYLYKQVAAPVTMGFSTRVEWKNFDLGFSLRANLGNYVFNNFEQGKRLKTTSSVWCQNAYLANRPVNTLGWDSDALESKLSDYFVQNASFLKMDNITLGYSFNRLFKSGSWKGISGRVYASCSNVFTITNYKGIDPEVYNGIDNNIYPRPITFQFGLNLTF